MFALVTGVQTCALPISQLPEDERIALAQLTRDIHAPLANRLGIWQLKWELEDLAFRHLDPDTYRRIPRLLDDKRTGRERYIAHATPTLRDALAAQGVDAAVAGRRKHIYSIWLKMRMRSEEHTSELQSPMRTSYASFCSTTTTKTTTER